MVNAVVGSTGELHVVTWSQERVMSSPSAGLCLEQILLPFTTVRLKPCPETKVRMGRIRSLLSLGGEAALCRPKSRLFGSKPLLPSRK